MCCQKSTVLKSRRRPPDPLPLPPARSEAITLLAALQREARLVDLVKQPLVGFSDEEIGGRRSQCVGRLRHGARSFFGLQPVARQEEGSPCDVPAGYDPGCFKLSGRVEGTGPFHGKLAHHGWKATAVKLPTWTGSKDAATWGASRRRL